MLQMEQKINALPHKKMWYPKITNTKHESWGEHKRAFVRYSSTSLSSWTVFIKMFDRNLNTFLATQCLLG